jgi:hypothetical protein
MKMRTTVSVVAILLLLLATAAQASSRNPTGGVSVRTGVTSGGSYRLTSLAWQGSITARGGGYHLLVAYEPRLTGSGCCCTYLPCIVR